LGRGASHSYIALPIRRALREGCLATLCVRALARSGQTGHRRVWRGRHGELRRLARTFGAREPPRLAGPADGRL